ncbi:hypothetical protein HZF24_15520 [Sedimentibacter hydroxybenzoicus DSM 7310]|uniref:Uncharacterized protein n=1 Tax=Sedimentibacter hydroxybenzoicus DSM 7310 TaxID=1123245 RepID=A0A974BMR0_SEDHY|nr:hypothetical protein [Sedimentibacter hydroxybenzoicus]NYB75557.1 hypothetical protein [Sedimentibacter hydroxybenzoicus DSM 7310]
MTLAKKIEELLKDELEPENVKTIINIAEYLKFKETQDIWDKINESEHEYISEKELKLIEKIKAQGEFISQDELLGELGINGDEI